MKILGISALYHDAAAALTVDGVIVAAAQEERFTRIKHDKQIPVNAIQYCLREGRCLFSDIDMPDMGGLELGKRLDEKGGSPYLVFLTAYLEYAAESYIIEAYQYILKEDMEKRLPPILRQLIDRVKKEKKQFRMVGTLVNNKVRVYYRDMIYIEKDKGSKYICYITEHGIYKERITLKKLIEELASDEFILIERRYIINVSHIASMKDGTVLMDNEVKIFVNRISFKKIKEQISLYRGNL